MDHLCEGIGNGWCHILRLCRSSFNKIIFLFIGYPPHLNYNNKIHVVSFPHIPYIYDNKDFNLLPVLQLLHKEDQTGKLMSIWAQEHTCPERFLCQENHNQKSLNIRLLLTVGLEFHGKCKFIRLRTNRRNKSLKI